MADLVKLGRRWLAVILLLAAKDAASNLVVDGQPLRARVNSARARAVHLRGGRGKSWQQAGIRQVSAFIRGYAANLIAGYKPLAVKVSIPKRDSGAGDIERA